MHFFRTAHQEASLSSLSLCQAVGCYSVCCFLFGFLKHPQIFLLPSIVVHLTPFNMSLLSHCSHHFESLSLFNDCLSTSLPLTVNLPSVWSSDRKSSYVFTFCWDTHMLAHVQYAHTPMLEHTCMHTHTRYHRMTCTTHTLNVTPNVGP